ncbi:MAG TPA: hypothetical protein VM936_14305 [Pyrinomonadaceae bacterium]|nr:hypothetical protein [Pyrinomonadaceae bacterium]
MPGGKRHDEARDDDARAESREGEDVPAAGVILVAFEKLFGGGRGVRRFSRSGLRHVELPEGATLIEQNPKKSSEWADLARQGRRVAWVMRDGEYLARVVDGEVTFLK